MARIDVSGIIGREWSVDSDDCLAVCVEVLERLGMHEAAEAAQSSDYPHFSPASEPYRLGDIVLSEGADHRLHTSIVYDDASVRVVSSSKSVGGYTCRVAAVRGIIEVYRYDYSKSQQESV